MTVTVVARQVAGLEPLTLVRQAGRSGAARALREAAGASQAELAAPCGVLVPTISRWESGKRIPRSERAACYIESLTVLATLIDPPDHPGARELRERLLALREASAA